ncbi:MAG: hypothetical protein KY456_06620 [Chloroflexi bacterium]|nr:hypothetical protein [Chloroflexota bacterium]
MIAIFLLLCGLLANLLAMTEVQIGHWETGKIHLMFESMSALATMGASTGITPALTVAGKGVFARRCSSGGWNRWPSSTRCSDTRAPSGTASPRRGCASGKTKRRSRVALAAIRPYLCDLSTRSAEGSPGGDSGALPAAGAAHSC